MEQGVLERLLRDPEHLLVHPGPQARRSRQRQLDRRAVRSLQEGDWISVTPIDGGWARLPVFLAELTGIHPTREGIFVQLVLLGIYLVGAAYMFAWLPLRRRALEAASA